MGGVFVRKLQTSALRQVTESVGQPVSIINFCTPPVLLIATASPWAQRHFRTLGKCQCEIMTSSVLSMTGQEWPTPSELLVKMRHGTPTSKIHQRDCRRTESTSPSIGKSFVYPFCKAQALSPTLRLPMGQMSTLNSSPSCGPARLLK